MTRTLAIETSCDDTSLAIVSYDGDVFLCEQMKAYSQIDDHQQYGGVVPEIASRQHSEKIIAVYQSLSFDRDDIDCISVTTSPGLPGSLLVGKAFAATLGEQYNKPVIQVNHIHGHILSFLLERKQSEINFPVMVLSVSGGHNDLYLLSDTEIAIESSLDHQTIGPYHSYKLGQTIDDAVGEAFDKTSRLLGGPYPGGPWIQEQALLATEFPYTFKAPYLQSGNFLFSFSGLKSQVYYLLDQMNKKEEKLTPAIISQIAHAFQEAACKALVTKTIKATTTLGVPSVALVGGVSASKRLREYFTQEFSGEFMHPVSFAYCTDNAAMIGTSGLLTFSLLSDS